MEAPGHTRRMLGLFADLLEYPECVPTSAAGSCAVIVEGLDPGIAADVEVFAAAIEPYDTGSLQELYTQTFDLEATWHPYLGYHLFGETYQRSVFLVELKERYERHEFEVETELPDHLPVVLRFLSVCDDDGLLEEIVTEGLTPVLEKMLGAEKEGVDKEEVDKEEAVDEETERPAESEAEPEEATADGPAVAADPGDDGQQEPPQPYRVLLGALLAVLHEIYGPSRLEEIRDPEPYGPSLMEQPPCQPTMSSDGTPVRLRA